MVSTRSSRATCNAYRPPRGPWLVVLAALALGCASSGVSRTARYAPDAGFAEPSIVWVYDFATTDGEIALDTGWMNGGDESYTEQRRVAAMVAETVAVTLVEELSARGIRAIRARSDLRPPEGALLVKGSFVSVDEGSRAQRMTVGFGLGASELSADVRTFQMTASGAEPLSEARATASGSKLPGIAMPVGAGAAAGRVATSVAISGTATVTREVTGSLEGDAKRLAKALADRAERYWRSRGWL